MHQFNSYNAFENKLVWYKKDVFSIIHNLDRPKLIITRFRFHRIWDVIKENLQRSDCNL